MNHETPYKREVLKKDSEEEVVEIVWSPGAKSMAHDHGESHGWTLVISGAVRVKTFDKATRVTLSELSYGPGESFRETDDEIHIVSNPGLESAKTLHHYSPPLKMTFYPEIV